MESRADGGGIDAEGRMIPFGPVWSSNARMGGLFVRAPFVILYFRGRFLLAIVYRKGNEALEALITFSTSCLLEFV